MDKRELKSFQKDLLLAQKTRAEATEKLRKILQELDSNSMLATTLTLMIKNIQKKIDDPTIKAAFKGRLKRKK